MTPELTKQANLPPGFQLFHTGLTALPLSPGFPESCTVPELSRIPAFEMLSRTSKQTLEAEDICPNPKRISAAIRTTKKSIMGVW